MNEFEEVSQPSYFLVKVFILPPILTQPGTRQ